jgi:hypothetical protein
MKREIPLRKFVQRRHWDGSGAVTIQFPNDVFRNASLVQMREAARWHAVQLTNADVSRETLGAEVPWESASLPCFFSFRQTK